MPTLHIVRQSAFSTNDLAQCLQVLSNNDVIVFIDDACYNVTHSLIKDSDLSSRNIVIQIMAHHASARGINIDEAIFSKISMHDLVTLTLKTARVITWQ